MLEDLTQNSMELVVSQPLKEFRACLETRMYIAVFTRAQALDICDCSQRSVLTSSR